MDYDELFDILPKTHWQWNIQDTKSWLTFIGLDSLHNKFQICSIDGSILNSLTEDDFKKQLEITSRIIIKKLMNWINHGIPQFDQFVEQQIRSNLNMKRNETQFASDLLRSKSGKKEQKGRQVKNKGREMSLTEQPRRYQANELIIKQLQQTQVCSFYLKEKGGMIGRHAENQIVILDQFVSRYHAKIIYENEQYYIRDCGSSSGTFFRIAQKLSLAHGMIIEMGSNQFEVILDEGTGNLTMKVVEGPNLENVYSFVGQETYSIGRKQSNYISFGDDQHLSGIHSKVFRIKGDWFIQDIATTNGTWLRLSREANESEPYLLEDRCQFKLSSNLIYECQLNSNNRRTFKSGQQKCLFCKVEDKNSIIMPCKHAVGCQNCLAKQTNCPLCQSHIQEVIKMFTS